MAATSLNIPSASTARARAQAVVDAAAVKNDERLAVKYAGQLKDIESAIEVGSFSKDISFAETDDNGVELKDLLVRYGYLADYKNNNISLGLLTVSWNPAP